MIRSLHILFIFIMVQPTPITRTKGVGGGRRTVARRSAAAAAVLLAASSQQNASASWVDPDSPYSAKLSAAHTVGDDRQYELVSLSVLLPKFGFAHLPTEGSR